MPRSWLKPALAVKRSALALSRVDWLLLGEAVSRSLVASISCQVLPSLLGSVYWLVETALWVVGSGLAGLEMAARLPPTRLPSLTAWTSNQIGPPGTFGIDRVCCWPGVPGTTAGVARVAAAQLPSSIGPVVE